MRLEYADIWSFLEKADALCITTNGCLRKAGRNSTLSSAVMGAGVALSAAKKYPALPRSLAAAILKNGNSVAVIHDNPIIVAFPTKPGYVAVTPENRVNLLAPYRNAGTNGSILPGWMFKSDPALIEESARHLSALIAERGWNSVALPCPGCENGGLSWTEVEKILGRHLDSRVVCVTRPNGVPR